MSPFITVTTDPDLKPAIPWAAAAAAQRASLGLAAWSSSRQKTHVLCAGPACVACLGNIPKAHLAYRMT